jgi:CheY-like chemotaxis protein
MDHMMPELDGVETTRIIREEIGTDYAKSIPIIALTANAIVGSEKMFLENGFQAFLSKPIDIMCLDAVIRQWIRRKEHGQAQTGFGGERIDGMSGSEDSYEENDVRAEEASTAPTGPIGFFGEHVLDGVDLVKALARFGGDPAALKQVLRSYAVNTPPLLAEMRAIAETRRADADGTQFADGAMNAPPPLPEAREAARARLADYAVKAHGIKGSSRGICAEQIGDLAEALELAAKAGDFEFVAENSTVFLDATGKLIHATALLLEKFDAAHPKPKRDAPDTALLGRMRACCENYDMDGVDGAMAELERFDYTSQADLVLWLRARVDSMDFQEILNRLPASE